MQYIEVKSEATARKMCEEWKKKADKLESGWSHNYYVMGKKYGGGGQDMKMAVCYEEGCRGFTKLIRWGTFKRPQMISNTYSCKYECDIKTYKNKKEAIEAAKAYFQSTMMWIDSILSFYVSEDEQKAFVYVYSGSRGSNYYGVFAWMKKKTKRTQSENIQTDSNVGKTICVYLTNMQWYTNEYTPCRGLFRWSYVKGYLTKDGKPSDLFKDMLYDVLSDEYHARLKSFTIEKLELV